MSRRTFIGIFGFLLALMVVGAPRLVLAGNCDCTCRAPGGGEQASFTQSCTTRSDCSLSVCQSACTAMGAGYTAAPPSDPSINNFTCIGADEPAPATAPATTPPSGGATTPSATGSGNTSSGGTTAPGTTQGAGTPAPSTTQAPPPPAGTLRLVLPSCTETGNCSLTDIINTGIRIANLLMSFAGFVFLATVLWAGAQVLVFANEADRYKKAQKMIEGAVLGLVIIMVAGVLVRLVSDTLGVNPRMLEAPGGTSSNAPRPPSVFQNMGPGSGNGALPASPPSTQTTPPSN